MTRADWLAFVQALGGIGVVLFVCGSVWLFADWLADRRDPEPQGATEEWHPADYREAIHAGPAAAEHEPLTWEQRQRVFADEIAWYQRRVRAINTPTRSFKEIAKREGYPVTELGPVEPVRTETGDGWQQPALRLRGGPPVVEEITR